MPQFEYIPKNEIDQYKPNNAFIAKLSSNLQGKDELLLELKDKLLLPIYFGFNWDALEECLRDFHWIKEKAIALVHNDLPLLNPADERIYLEILISASNDWKTYEEHSFQVIFPNDEQTKISSLIHRFL